jgi:hypothetical protein
VSCRPGGQRSQVGALLIRAATWKCRGPDRIRFPWPSSPPAVYWSPRGWCTPADPDLSKRKNRAPFTRHSSHFTLCGRRPPLGSLTSRSAKGGKQPSKAKAVRPNNPIHLTKISQPRPTNPEKLTAMLTHPDNVAFTVFSQPRAASTLEG